MAISSRVRGKKTVWIVQLRDPQGQPYPSKTFEKKKDASDYETELKTLKLGGVKVKHRDVREMTMAEFWVKWSSEMRGDTSKGWRLQQDRMWRLHIEPVLGLVPVMDLEKSDVARFLVKMQDEKYRQGPQSRLHLYNLLHKMMDDAVQIYEVRDSNPVIKRFKPSVPKVERAFMKPVAAQNFLTAVSEHRLGAAFWLMIHCGFRSGEMQAMRRKNIDLDEARISIDTQWVRNEKAFGPLKNDKPLTVPMTPELVRYLSSKLDPKMDREQFVVTCPKGGMVSHMMLYHSLKLLCKEHGMEHLSPHELRHTCSALWVSKGATRADIKQLFNHSTESSTDGYMHLDDDRLRDISIQKAKSAKVVLRRVK